MLAEGAIEEFNEMDEIFQDHLSAEGLQGFLEGELSSTEHSAVEEHLELCRRCSADVDVWRVLFSKLGSLQVIRPHEGFQERVMAGVHLPVRIPLVARVRARISGLIPRASEGHISHDRLQEKFEGSLSSRQVAQIDAHLGSCEACAGQAKAWQAVFSSLDELDRLEPSAGFADRIMEGVRQSTRPTSGASERVWGWAACWDAVCAPKTSRAWGVLAGAGVTPALALGFIVYLIFSYTLLTPGALAYYSWWQMTNLVAWAWTGLPGLALESGLVLEVYNLFRGVADVMSTRVVLGALGLYSVGIVFALSVIYKQLIVTRTSSH